MAFANFRSIDRVSILRLGIGFGKSVKLRPPHIVAGPRDSNVFAHYGIAFFLNCSRRTSSMLGSDTDHVKGGPTASVCLRNFISGDVG